MVDLKNMDIGDLVCLEYKNRLHGDVSEVTGFVYELKIGELRLSRYNPKKASPWNQPWEPEFNVYSVERILSYEVLKKAK